MDSRFHGNDGRWKRPPHPLILSLSKGNERAAANGGPLEWFDKLTTSGEESVRPELVEGHERIGRCPSARHERGGAGYQLPPPDASSSLRASMYAGCICRPSFNAATSSS